MTGLHFESCLRFAIFHTFAVTLTGLVNVCKDSLYYTDSKVYSHSFSRVNPKNYYGTRLYITSGKWTRFGIRIQPITSQHFSWSLKLNGRFQSYYSSGSNSSTKNWRKEHTWGKKYIAQMRGYSNLSERCGEDSSGSGQEPLVGCCEHSYEKLWIQQIS